MNRPTHPTRRFAVPFAVALVSAVAASTPKEARASGYLTARFGSDHGTPAVPNTYAIYFNPAAMAGAKRTTLLGDVSLALRWARYSRSQAAFTPTDSASLSDPQYVSANGGAGNLLNLLALPYAGVNTDFGTSRLRGGYAIYIPFGGMATWDRREGTPGIPGSTDGAQRWHNISGQILAIYNTLAASYTVYESSTGGLFSLGANVSGVYNTVATVRARNADNSDDVTDKDGLIKEGRSYLDAHGFNVAATVGAYYQAPEDRFRVGLSYLAKPGFGETRMAGTLTQQLGRGALVDDGKKIDFIQSWPDIIRLGGTYLLPGDRVELRSDLEYVRWSSFERQCVVEKGSSCNINADGSTTDNVILNIERKWRDAVGYRLGAGYFLSRDMELFGSAAFTTSAVPKTTIDSSTIDSFRLYGTVGVRKTFGRHVALAGSYNHIYFLPVDTKGQNRHDELSPPSKSPSADGRYNSQIGMLNVNVAYTF